MSDPKIIYAVEGPINPRSGARTLLPALGEPAEVKALRARITELETALKPFVRHGAALGAFGGKDNGPFWIYDDRGYRDVPAEDFIRARAALASPQREGDRPASPNDGREREPNV